MKNFLCQVWHDYFKYVAVDHIKLSMFTLIVFFMLQYLLIMYLILLLLQTRGNGLHIDSSTMYVFCKASLKDHDKCADKCAYEYLQTQDSLSCFGLNKSSIWFCSAVAKIKSGLIFVINPWFIELESLFTFCPINFIGKLN